MKTRFLGGALAALLLAVPAAFAQSPRGSVEAMVGSANVSIEYGRPSLNGRDMLRQATEGMVWRLGADTSTTLTTSGDLDFAGTTVAAGSYSLFAKRAADGWKLLVNSQTGQWGTEHDASMDLFEIPLATHAGDPREQFTVVLHGMASDGMLHFEWGETILMAMFTAE